MDTEHAEIESLHITQDKLLAFACDMIGIYNRRDEDDHPLPPGPWDPVIRKALQHIDSFGPHPEPWKALCTSILAKHPEIHIAVGGSLDEKITLNPQPLPPRYAFFVAAARELVSRAELLQEIADATVQAGTQQGIIIVGGFTGRFTNDWCGNEFKLRWPFPGPRPHWFTRELSGIDLVVMAAQFHQAAKDTFSPELRQCLGDAGAKFVSAGLSKMH